VTGSPVARYEGAAGPERRRCRGVRAVWSLGKAGAAAVALASGSHGRGR
jgi:hypothetical protein